MTRVLFLGAPVDGVAQLDVDADEKFTRTGGNTGNLLIGWALRRQIACSSYAYGSAREVAAADEEFDLIAIPAANFLFERFDFGWMADFIEKTSLPCLMVGLGAQAPSSSGKVTPPPGTIRLVEVVAERTQKIGVRGQFTAELLQELGIDNVAITGCPSIYGSLCPRLGIDKRPYSADFAISLNGSRNVIPHSYAPDKARAVEGALLKIAVDRGYDYVLQNEFPEIALLHSAPLNESRRQELSFALSYLGLTLEPQEYAAIVSRQGRAFFSVEEWAQYIRTKDFSLGTRFHGNVIALLNGVPAVAIAHDSRTIEMCEFAKMPHLRVDQIGVIDPERIYREADFAAFEAHYSEIFMRYQRFLEENRVPHNLATSFA